jgi:hypothetical protein
VKAAVLSHNLPEGSKPALCTRYGLPSRPKDGVNGQINLIPVAIHWSNLCTLEVGLGEEDKVQKLTKENLERLLLDSGMFYPWT